jgi:hypothetical protein
MVGIYANLFPSANLPAFSLGFNRNLSTNLGQNFGFENALNSLNASVAYGYSTTGFKGNARLFTNFSGVDNGWTMNRFSGDSTHSTADTSFSITSAFYGINHAFFLINIPLDFNAGFMSNAGIGEFTTIHRTEISAGYQVLPKRFYVKAGGNIQKVSKPQNSGTVTQTGLNYSFRFQHHVTHQAILEGRTDISKEDTEFSNTFRYEWRF